jgi:3',5'-cyclic AMP phosphodiesterase CpdA
MSRIIVITDVHGMADELSELLGILDIQPDDDCICLGDITDKGPEPVHAARLLMAHDFELTASNHDDAYVKFLKKGKTPAQVLAGKSKYKERRAEDYARLLEAEDVCNYLLTKKAYIQRTVPANVYDDGPRLITFVHAGVTPNHDLYNMNGKTYNEIIRVRYLDPETKDMVAMKNIGGVYPDQEPNWVPSQSNVIEWQEVYDYRYGTIIHGHNIVGDMPKLWGGGSQMFKGKRQYFRLKGSAWPGEFGPEWDAYLPHNGAISLDTGAFKAGKLTAMVINQDGSFYFEQVNCETAYR